MLESAYCFEWWFPKSFVFYSKYARKIKISWDWGRDQLDVCHSIQKALVPSQHRINLVKCLNLWSDPTGYVDKRIWRLKVSLRYSVSYFKAIWSYRRPCLKRGRRQRERERRERREKHPHTYLNEVEFCSLRTRKDAYQHSGLALLPNVCHHCRTFWGWNFWSSVFAFANIHTEADRFQVHFKV